MIRFRACWGIDPMKRILTLLLVAVLVAALVGCNGEGDVTTGHAFSQDADGFGVTDTVTGIHYTALSLSFEPAVTAGLVGTYVDGTYTRSFYEVKGLDTALYIADGEMGVWYAGEVPPDPVALTVTDALVCEQTAFSRELFRFSSGSDSEMIARIRQLWLEGEAAEYPQTTVLKKRTVKWKFTELANIFYCFDIGLFEEGAFFYDKMTGRAVAVPDELANELFKE